MSVRGIRGANNAENNSAESIKNTTQCLIKEILRQNKIETSQIISIFLTATDDLDAAFPACGVREMGEEWSMVPLLCSREINVKGAMKSVIRVLILTEIAEKNSEIKHIYLGETKKLRPDISKEQTN